MRKFKTGLAALAIFAVSFQAVGCSTKQTTLDRVGGVVLIAVQAYEIQLNQLLAQNALSVEKHDALLAQAKAIEAKAQALSSLISGFGSIDNKNVAAVLVQVSGLVSLLSDSLKDTALAGLPSDSGVFKALNYAIATLNSAAAVLAILFPPPQVATAGAHTRAVPSGVAPSKINVPLPPKPKGI